MIADRNPEVCCLCLQAAPLGCMSLNDAKEPGTPDGKRTKELKKRI